MYEIRPEQPLDCEAIAAVNRLAFGRKNEAELIERIRQSDRYIPSLSLVALVEDIVAGHAMFSYIDLVGDRVRSVLGLAPIAVMPEFQKQGIGSGLVRAGLKLAEERGEPLVIVLGDPQYYFRFGFEASTHYAIESPFSVPEEAFMVKLLKSYRDYFKGKVVYPTAFDEV